MPRRRRDEPFFFIPINPEQAQVSVPTFRSGSGKFDPHNRPINEAGTVVESQARGSAGMLGQGGQVSISPTNSGRAVRATGRNLGAMGFLDSEIIIAIQMDYTQFMQFQLYARRENDNLDDRDLLITIKRSLYDPLYLQLKQLINSIVPKDSGRLRNAMELAVGGGSHGGSGAAGGGSTSQIGSLNPFYVILNTGKVPYAPVVNRMQTSWLKHFGGLPHRGYAGTSKRTGRTVHQKPHNLDDPNAVTGWYQNVLDQGRHAAINLWNGLVANAGPLAQKMQPIIRYFANPNRGYGTQQVPIMVTAYDLLKNLFAVRFN